MADASAETSVAATTLPELNSTQACLNGTAESDNKSHGGTSRAASAIAATLLDDERVESSGLLSGEGVASDGAADTVMRNSNGGGRRKEDGHPSDEEDEEADAKDEEDDGDDGQMERVAASDVKNIILQALSPYFDDDAGGTATVMPGVDLNPVPSSAGGGVSASKPNSAQPGTHASSAVASASISPAAAVLDDDHGVDDTAQRYDHTKAEEWIALVCDGIMERLVALGKPFKFVVHAMVMRKSGAGVHVCSSCCYAPMDGWLSHAHDLSAHLYAVVTVYWCSI